MMDPCLSRLPVFFARYVLGTGPLMLPEEEEGEATEGEEGGSGTYFFYFILLCLTFSGGWGAL